MRTRLRIAFALIALAVGAAAPPRADAAVIGTFEWLEFLGHGFSLTNDSDLAGFADSFTDLSLLVGTDSDADGVLEDVFEAFPAALSLDDPDTPDLENSYSITFDGPFTSAVLSFRFAPDGYVPLSFSQEFSGPTTQFIEFTPQLPDPGPTPVPEPSSILLLSSGLAALAGARRRGRSPKAAAHRAP